MGLAPKVSIILPCFNEEASITTYLQAIRSVITAERLDAEIIVINNNSTDGSTHILAHEEIQDPRLRVIHEGRQGYGFAYMRGLEEARGELLLLVDFDESYAATDIPLLLDALIAGADLALGNRFSGAMHTHAMPRLHRYIGNPLLSFLMRRFFGTNVRDTHCGLRAITRSAYKQLNLVTGGMEFASEMIIKAVRAKLTIQEVPVRYHPRTGTSKLRSFRDGWRHLRFMLLYSPLYLFLVPGVCAVVLGGFLMVFLYAGKLSILGTHFIVHPMFVASLLLIVGYQLITFAGFAKAYAFTHLGERTPFLERFFARYSLEHAALLGVAGIAIGFLLYCFILYKWILSDFGSLDEIKNAVLGLTLMVLGIQTISAAFMTSMLGIAER
ncbi:MAG: hypothetical protein RL150_442 [Candidatus Parcubacteria bacterium]|jgi:glycosyltransferase involved in cell wall biosynthesis